MRKAWTMMLGLLVCVAMAAAQDKIETKWHCDKPASQQAYEVGDVAGHSYTIAQGTCSVTSGGSGEKTAAFTEFQEVWKTRYTNHGRLNATMDNGDKTYYTYQGSGDPVKKSATNTFKIASGTGKHKDAKGSGACTGTFNADGSSDWTCTGTMGGGAAAK
jgi:hypothetical protein